MADEMKPIPRFPGYFAIKNGRIWKELKYNNTRGRFLKLTKTIKGYMVVSLHKDRKGFQKQVHRLILETFIGPCPKGMMGCHNNGNKTDNGLENLRWDTQSANTFDSIIHGTHPNNIGEANGRSKLNKLQVRIIRHLLKFGTLLEREIAGLSNVTRSTISDIKVRKSWKHI